MTGPDGLIYPGTCRGKPRTPQAPLPDGTALRLDLAAALDRIGGPIGYAETGLPQPPDQDAASLVAAVGDVVLSRRDFPGSYHLSVVLDDAAQGVTHVTRGADLADATWIHVILQRLLGLETPVYHHHRLIRDEAGKRLAKRDDARALARFRDDGASPADIRAMVGL